VNKRQIEVQKHCADREEKVIKDLKLAYGKAQCDCVNKIIDLSKRRDMENLQSIIWQKQYQEALNKQLESVLNTLESESFVTVADYLAECYEDGFWGTLYDLQGQGIPLMFPMNQEQALQAVQVDSKISQGLYRRMGEDIDLLKKSIRIELARGIANGSSWNEVAEKIARGMNSPFDRAYNRAVGIARTEGHRVQQESTLHCQQRAIEKGADMVKQWDSTLDSLTRPNHVTLNGQVRETDEPFEVAGKKAMYPGGFGDPSEDCNCRCCLLSRARSALSQEEYYTKWDGDKDELIKVHAETFGEFKQEAQKIFSDWQNSQAGQSFSSKKEAFNHFTDCGIKISDSRKYPMDEQLAIQIAEWHSKFREKYISFTEKIVHKIPEIKNVAPSALSSGTLGQFSYYINGVVDGIKLNAGLFSSLDYASKISATSTESGWHSGKNPIHTFIHEWGHYVSHSMGELQKDFEHFIIKESLDEYKLIHPEYTMRTYIGLKDAVSKYGTKSESELFAECFAEYFGEENPREFATIFGKKLEKALEEIK